MLDDKAEGIFFEMTVIGNSVKVVAIDSKTGTEAILIAPKNTPVFSLKENAKRKLRYVMNKKGQS